MKTLKNSIAIAVLCITALVLSAGAQAPAKTVSKQKTFASVEKMPTFPGGIEKMYEYINTRIRYPKTDMEKSTSGVVLLTFIVEADGRLTEVKALRGPSDSMNKEAVRVVKTSPTWKPGMQNGKPVRVEYFLPVKFSLSES